jgi:hypothetical protein
MKVVDRNKFVNYLLAIQGIYSLVTALWGLADIDSFMEVTGPKTDVWLVKTVSVLIIPIAFCLISAIYIKNSLMPVAVVGLTSALGLGFIDFYYAINDVISDVYLGDGFMQLFFVISWMFAFPQLKKERIE